MEIKDNDCVNCKHWRSNTISYPSGRCSLSGLFCGLGDSCESFEKREPEQKTDFEDKHTEQ